MNIFKYILRVVFKKKFYLLLIPIFAALIAVLLTVNMGQTFKVTTTIFTGFATGYSIESGSNSVINYSAVNSAMDNLMNIIKSKTTLERVSTRLYVENMIYGDSTKDNTTIRKNNYQEIFNRTPIEVRDLIEKNSIKNTIDNLNMYKRLFLIDLQVTFHQYHTLL